MAEAFPLQWPAGWKRSTFRQSSKFKDSREGFGRVRDGLFAEVRRFGGTGVVLSTNVPITKDGIPYAKFASPSDPGVAIYFQRKGKPAVLACDKWRTVGENVRALQLTVEAMRGIDRWGSSELMERSFTGFTALPPPPATEPVVNRTWKAILGFHYNAVPSPAQLREKRNELLRKFHPDVGSSPDNKAAAEVNRAFEEAIAEITE